jgi:uncharacterized protein (DUF1684 family)
MWDIKNEQKKQATLSVRKAEHNKQTGWCSECSCTWITDVGILARKVTVKMPDS